MKEGPPPDDTDWDDDEEEDDDWGDPPDEDPESEPSRKFWSLGMIIMWIVILALAILVALPLLLRGGSRNGYRVEAINNAKQIGLALLEFDQDYGKFPDETTLQAVLGETGTLLDLSGDSANAQFRQLIAYGLRTEEIFFCKHPQTRRPDNMMGPGEALAPGEVGFSYVAGLHTRMDPALPVLAAPMKWGTMQFHNEPSIGKAVILRVDNAAKALPIGKRDGKAWLAEGRGVFDPDNGVWPKGHVIDLRHPEP